MDGLRTEQSHHARDCSGGDEISDVGLRESETSGTAVFRPSDQHALRRWQAAQAQRLRAMASDTDRELSQAMTFG